MKTLTSALTRILGPVGDPAWRKVLLKILVFDFLAIGAFTTVASVSAGGQATVQGIVGAFVLLYSITVLLTVQFARTRWGDRP